MACELRISRIAKLHALKMISSTNCFESPTNYQLEGPSQLTCTLVHHPTNKQGSDEREQNTANLIKSWPDTVAKSKAALQDNSWSSNPTTPDDGYSMIYYILSLLIIFQTFINLLIGTRFFLFILASTATEISDYRLINGVCLLGIGPCTYRYRVLCLLCYRREQRWQRSQTFWRLRFYYWVTSDVLQLIFWIHKPRSLLLHAMCTHLSLLQQVRGGSPLFPCSS